MNPFRLFRTFVLLIFAVPYSVFALAAPSISSVSPNPVTGVALPGRVSLTLNGSNFVSKPTVFLTWTGGSATLSSSNVTFFSSSRVDITVATDVTADNWTVRATNPDGQQSNAVGFQVVAPGSPAPVISNVTPNPVTGVALPGRVNVTVNGSNFVNKPTAFLTWTGGSATLSSANTSFISSTQVILSVATDVVADNWTVKVTNPDGKVSNTANFQVVAPANPAPVISNVTPNPVTGVALPGRVNVTLTGSNFTNGLSAFLTWSTGSASLSSANTTFVSSTQVILSVATDATPDSWTVKVTNPDGKVSNTGNFQVVAPATSAPVISNVTPNPVTGVALPGRVNVTLTGSNFTNGLSAFLTWSTGSASLSSANTTFVSSTQVILSVATDATPDSWTVKVTNPDGKVSNTPNFQVVAPSASGTGVDYSFSHPSPTGLKAAGYNFAVRYVGGSGAPHDITASEAQALQNAGIDIIVVFESTTGRMKGGYVAGVADANTAVGVASGAGAPNDFFCYFACDFDASLSDQAAIDAYLDGAKSVLGGVHRVGFYGGYWPLKRVLDGGKAAKGWQTAAWSNGNRDPRISIYQRPGQVTIAGGTCDIDDAYSPDLGQWSVHRAAQAPDLIIEAGSISFDSTTVGAGGSFGLSFRVKNNGLGAAVATKARLRLSTDTVLTRDDSPLSPLDVNIPSLQSGGVYTFNQTVQVPSTTAQGKYYIGVFADAENVAGQSDITNDLGISATTLNITAVGVSPPVITLQPTSTQVNAGGTATFTVQTQGVNPQYRWMRYSNPVGNETASLTLTNVSSIQAGEYWVQVSNAGGTVQSNHAVLAVNPSVTPPVVSPQGGQYTLYGTFNPALPTIVITHGWQRTGSYDPANPPVWMSTMRESIVARLESEGKWPADTSGHRANILLFTWPDAFFADPWRPYISVHYEGQQLASYLKPLLGQNYTKPIHFIGHSFGTFVNAYAVEELSITVDQFTILDAPIGSDPKGWLYNPWLGSFFARHLSRSNILWVDNYIASIPTFPFAFPFGDYIEGAAPNQGLGTNTAHETIQDGYYIRTITGVTSTGGFNDSVLVNIGNRPAPLQWSPPVTFAEILSDAPDVARFAAGEIHQVADQVRGQFRNVFQLVKQAITPQSSAPFASAAPALAAISAPQDAVLEYDLTVPQGAAQLTFDFLFSQLGDGDWLAISFNGTLLYNFLGKSFDGTDYHQAEIPIANFAGQTGVLTVTLHSASTAASEVRVSNFKFLSQTAPLPSSNADLASLVPGAGALSPAFASGTLNYTATVPKSVLDCTVKPTVVQAGATVTVNGIAVTSGSASGNIPLTIGSNNVITMMVTAPDGVTTQTYTLTVTRASRDTSRNLNGDSNADIVFQNNLGQIAAWYMNGAGVNTSTVFLSTSALGDWRIVGVADMNGDGKADILFQNTLGQIVVWYMDGAGAKTSSGYLSTNALGDWRVVSVADMNNDGNADIIFQNNAGQIVVWYRNSSGAVTSSVYLTTSALGDWRVVGVADMNNDGNADLIFQNTTGQVFAWYMDGAGTKTASGYLNTGALGDWRVVGVADMNNDGNADLIFQNTIGQIVAWYMNGAGTKTSSGYLSIGGLGDWRVR